MIYSPAVYAITEGNDQSNGNGQLNLHFIQWIIASQQAFYRFKSFKVNMMLKSVGYTLAKDTSQQFADSLYCAKREWEINGTDLPEPVYL